LNVTMTFTPFARPSLSGSAALVMLFTILPLFRHHCESVGLRMYLMLCIYRVEFRFSDTLSGPWLYSGATRCFAPNPEFSSIVTHHNMLHAPADSNHIVQIYISFDSVPVAMFVYNDHKGFCSMTQRSY
jgi:hypothetical protein